MKLSSTNKKVIIHNPEQVLKNEKSTGKTTEKSKDKTSEAKLNPLITPDPNRVLVNLRILAQVKHHQKISLNEGIFVIHTRGYGQSLSRWLSGANRSNAITAIEQCIEESFSQIDKIYKNEIFSKRSSNGTTYKRNNLQNSGGYYANAIRNQLNINPLSPSLMNTSGDNSPLTYQEPQQQQYQGNPEYFKTENSTALREYGKALEEAVNGLQSLKVTYSSDQAIQSRLSILIENVNERIAKIYNLLKVDM